MVRISIPFTVWVLTLVCVVEVDGQGRGASRTRSDVDELFPEIVGCVKVVDRVRRADGFAAQSATYHWIGDEKMRNDPNYTPCGSIEFRVQKNSRKIRADRWVDYFPAQSLRIRGYDAWRNSPLCGNDPWIGSIEIFLSDDEAIVLSATHSSPSILSFADTADLEKIARVLKSKL